MQLWSSVGSGFTDNAQLISLIVMTIYALTIELIFFVYYFKFIKDKTLIKKHMDNKAVLFISLLLVPIIAIITTCWILYNSTDSYKYETTLIVLTIIGFLFPFALTIYILVGVQYIAVGISGENFYLLGEKISISNITNLKFDTLSKKYFLCYKDKKNKNVKNISFKKNSKVAEFILEHKQMLNIDEIYQTTNLKENN
ncbi:hypothetical protein [Spiroplasma endosymbiont of Amphibalanus improvisus]|uniref:hypothetical protein n=1 Tax=Spiroplasma endosymbiont of Amphibalanus improvisus TaxID=3066327 RepID=UPI00313CF3A1